MENRVVIANGMFVQMYNIIGTPHYTCNVFRAFPNEDFWESGYTTKANFNGQRAGRVGTRTHTDAEYAEAYGTIMGTFGDAIPADHKRSMGEINFSLAEG